MFAFKGGGLASIGKSCLGWFDSRIFWIIGMGLHKSSLKKHDFPHVYIDVTFGLKSPTVNTALYFDQANWTVIHGVKALCIITSTL